MRIINTYYLVDYENVNSDGLAGCEKLTQLDHIVIFFTKNAMKINMLDIANHGDSKLDMIEVPPGKQSADIHISSYLGYLAGVNKGKDCKIVIISKDTDFDNIIKFWKSMIAVKASRKLQIKSSVSKSAVNKQSKSTINNTSKVDGNNKTKLNQEVILALRTAGFDASVANAVAKTATGFYGEEHLATAVHNSLQKQYKNYSDIYKAVKSVLSKYDKATKETPAEKSDTCQNTSALNNEIMKILSNVGFENEIVLHVASTVVKNIGVKNFKQQIYSTIISKYGQEKGLKIYNHIKKCLKK